MTADRAALVEKVNNAIFWQMSRTVVYDPRVPLYQHVTDAALDLALEEAAMVADEYAAQPATSDRIHDAGWNNASISITAAIRSLKSKP